MVLMICCLQCSVMAGLHALPRFIGGALSFIKLLPSTKGYHQRCVCAAIHVMKDVRNQFTRFLGLMLSKPLDQKTLGVMRQLLICLSARLLHVEEPAVICAFLGLSLHVCPEVWSWHLSCEAAPVSMHLCCPALSHNGISKHHQRPALCVQMYHRTSMCFPAFRQPAMVYPVKIPCAVGAVAVHESQVHVKLRLDSCGWEGQSCGHEVHGLTTQSTAKERP